MRRAGAAVAAMTAVLAGAAAPAASAADVFDGRCEMSGVTTLDRPMGGLPAENSYRDAGGGTCTGTLNGEAVEDTPVLMEDTGSGILGCLAGRGVMAGEMTYTRGTRSPRDDVVIGYEGESVGSMGQFVTRMRGEAGGVAVGYVRFAGDRETIEDCYAGTITSMAFDVTSFSFDSLAG